MYKEELGKRTLWDRRQELINKKQLIQTQLDYKEGELAQQEEAANHAGIFAKKKLEKQVLKTKKELAELYQSLESITEEITNISETIEREANNKKVQSKENIRYVGVIAALLLVLVILSFVMSNIHKNDLTPFVNI